MKKGLISVLGTVLLAIAGNGFANAPIISGVPDVVIGDDEDNVGQTVDQNFFRSLSAFNIMDYVTDADATSTPDVLKFAFDELGTGDPAAGGDINNISINDKLQVSSSDPATWGTDFIQGAYIFAFRDILRSPAAGTPPFADPTLADGTTLAGDGDLLPWNTAAGTLGGDFRQVTIFVADETDNVAQDTINVYSQNGAEDSLSGTFTTVFSDSTFAAADWAYQSFAAYSAATSGGGTGGGYIGMTAGATATTGGAFVGRWNQTGTGVMGFDLPIDAVASGLIYGAKVRLALQTAASGKAAAADIRFGVENSLQMLVTTNRLFSETFGSPDPNPLQTHLPDVGTAVDYNMYWSPGADLPQAASLADFDTGQGIVDLDGWHVFFDIVDLSNTDSGEWRMTNLEVVTFERPATDPTATPITNFTTWVPTNVGGATATVSATSAVFAGPATGTTTAYALLDKANVATWEAGKVLRVTAKLSTPNTTARDNLHQIRFRSGSAGPMVVQEFQIRRRSDIAPVAGALTPAATPATPTTYETYVPMYGGPAAALVTAGFDKYGFALDEIGDITSTAATTWTCHEVLFEVLDDPLM